VRISSLYALANSYFARQIVDSPKPVISLRNGRN
jgi:hypothetical protein